MDRSKVIHAFISKAISAGVGALVVLITSKLLGAEVRGIISLLLLWSGMWIMLSDFVTGSTLINLSAQHATRPLALKALLWLLILCAISFAVQPFLFPNLFAFVTLHLFLMGLFNIQGGILIGKQKVTLRNYAFSSINVVTLAITVFFILSNSSLPGLATPTATLSLKHYLIALISGWSFAVLLTLPAWFSGTTGKVQTTPGLLQMAAFGSASQLGHLIQYGTMRLPFTFIPILYNLEVLGVISIAIIMAETIGIISASLGQILHAKIIQNPQHSIHIQTTQRYARISVYLTLPALVLAALIPSSVWTYLLKDEFAQITHYFIFFAPAMAFQSLSGILSHFFHAQNQFNTLIKANVIGLILSICCMFLFHFAFQIEGLLFGLTLGYLAQMIYLLKVFKRASTSHANPGF